MKEPTNYPKRHLRYLTLGLITLDWQFRCALSHVHVADERVESTTARTLRRKHYSGAVETPLQTFHPRCPSKYEPSSSCGKGPTVYRGSGTVADQVE